MRKHVLALVLACVLLVALVPTSGSAAENATLDVTVTAKADYHAAYEVLELLNNLRKEAGLAPLVMDEELLADAMLRAAELQINYGHIRPDGSRCFTVLSSAYMSAAENIAYGQKDAKEVMKSWQTSPGHNANMLGHYSSVGIGCVYSESIPGSIGWVQLFAGEKEITPVAEPQSGETAFTVSVSEDTLSLALPKGAEKVNVVPGQAIDITLYHNGNPGWRYAAPAELVPTYVYIEDPTVAVMQEDGTVVGRFPGKTTVRVGLSETLWVPMTVTVTGKGPSAWAKAELMAAMDQGLVPLSLWKDMTKGITRAAVSCLFARLLEQATGKPVATLLQERGLTEDSAAFTDTQDPDVLALSALGILNGVGNGRFDPNGPLRRGQIAAIVNRIARLLGEDTTGYTHTFTDVSGMWVDNELGWPYQTGIIQGTDNNSFNPNGTLSMEATILVAYRTLNVLKKG